jgi:hypothetical protein
MALVVDTTCLHDMPDGHCLGLFFIYNNFSFHNKKSLQEFFSPFLCIGALALGFVG